MQRPWVFILPGRLFSILATLINPSNCLLNTPSLISRIPRLRQHMCLTDDKIPVRLSRQPKIWKKILDPATGVSHGICTANDAMHCCKRCTGACLRAGNAMPGIAKRIGNLFRCFFEVQTAKYRYKQFQMAWLGV